MDNQHPSRTLQRNGPVRWRGLTLAAVITAALAACGADQDNPRPATTTTPDKPSPAASTDPQGRRLRIQMTSTGGKNWELDLGELHRPDILAAHLATTNQYRLHDNR